MIEQKFDEYRLAIQDFRRARRKAALEHIMAFLKGGTTELFSYEDVRKKLKFTGSSGHKLKEIPIDAIIGSVGRYNDFTRNFLPKQDSTEHRWAKVQTLATGAEGFPPIEVYQIGDAYFVLDGNHRVSVARQLGATHIEAYVTEIRTKIPITPDIHPDELSLKAEYAAFLEHTRLDVLRPGTDLSMTIPGKYWRLEKQIERHRHVMGVEQRREIPYDEAVVHWHDTIYLPLKQMIQEQRILQDFPDRTLTDLYLWVSKLRETAQQIGAPGVETYVDEIQADVSSSPVSQLEELIINAEYAEFLEHTRLNELRPKADLQVTVPGKYRTLEEHIDVHRYFMGLERQQEIPYDEAVTHWYDTVYLPVKGVIREKGILRDFPERTATDLYLWISEHQAELEKQLGWKIPPERAATDLANRFSPTTERLIARVGERILDVVTPDELEAGPAPGQWRKEYLTARRNNRLFTNILVPVSGEEQGWSALDQAITFGQPKGARLYGLYVVPSGKPELLNKAFAVKTEFEQRCQTSGIQGELAIEVGRIARRICERAFWADLIIMNLAHPPGSQPIEKLKSGFRTIIRRCPRPILAVPRTATNMNRALLAYDGSPKSDEALFVSAYLAGCWNISLVVVTATEIGRITSETLSLAKRYLNKRDVKATFIEKKGNVEDLILDTAQNNQCDFIIMGGYGRNPVLEIVLGSAVDHVLRESQIPVLICR
jgi:nucleotide-binding universal stress UspA family protein